MKCELQNSRSRQIRLIRFQLCSAERPVVQLRIPVDLRQVLECERLRLQRWHYATMCYLHWSTTLFPAMRTRACQCELLQRLHTFELHESTPSRQNLGIDLVHLPLQLSDRSEAPYSDDTLLGTLKDRSRSFCSWRRNYSSRKKVSLLSTNISVRRRNSDRLTQFQESANLTD